MINWLSNYVRDLELSQLSNDPERLARQAVEVAKEERVLTNTLEEIQAKAPELLEDEVIRSMQNDRDLLRGALEIYYNHIGKPQTLSHELC